LHKTLQLELAEGTVLAAAGRRARHGGAGPSAVLAVCGGGAVEDLCHGVLDDPAIGLQRVEQVAEMDAVGPQSTCC
jgi:ABC-type hemin transport system ATPase subunit